MTTSAAVGADRTADQGAAPDGADGADPVPRTRNYRALLGQASAVSLANQLSATAVVLPYIGIAVGGSPLVAALLYPIGTFAALQGTLSAPVHTARRSNTFIPSVGAVISAAVSGQRTGQRPAWLPAGVVWPVYLLLGLTIAALGTVRLIRAVRLDG
ncbi:hypothetical protein [Nakamurella sp.]|uniref:hypothetical protein n=1 Tax=Nakamurella sp. TaxID=1869182 RepID=UPI003782EB8B